MMSAIVPVTNRPSSIVVIEQAPRQIPANTITAQNTNALARRMADPRLPPSSTAKKRAASKIQHAWRCHFRRKLKVAKQTFEKWQVATIQKNRKEDLHTELNRLKKKNISPNFRLNCVLPISIRFLFYRQAKTELQVILARALEIKRHYRESHYIFTHGQGHQWAIVAEVISQLMQKIHPSNDSSLFSYLRIPSEKRISVAEYIRQNPIINDDFDATRKQLLSCDAYFWRHAICESALFFLSQKDNIKRDITDVISELVRPFLSYWQWGTRTEIATKINAIATKRQGDCRVGNLFLICIPKKTLQNTSTNIVYRGKPFCVPIKAHSHVEEIKILDNLQDDESFLNVLASNIEPLPQYRMLIEQLRPEDGVRSFSISALSEKTLQQYKNEIAAALSVLKIETTTNQESIFEYWQNHIFSFIKSFW